MYEERRKHSLELMKSCEEKRLQIEDMVGRTGGLQTWMGQQLCTQRSRFISSIAAWLCVCRQGSSTDLSDCVF